MNASKAPPRGGDARLVGIGGPALGRVLLLGGELLTVGRMPSSGLVVEDSRVSRRHAELRRDANGWTLRDLHSAHGTLVNRVPVVRHALAAGDVIEFGDEAYRFEYASGPVRDPVEAGISFGRTLATPSAGVGLVEGEGRRAGARVRFLAGPSEGTVVELESDVVSLGRTPDNVIQVQSARASRRHAELRRERASWVLYDLGSSNGTRVNGELVQRRVLTVDDTVEIGEEHFVLIEDPVPSRRNDPMGPTEGPFLAGPMMDAVMLAPLASVEPTPVAEAPAATAPAPAPAFTAPPSPRFGPMFPEGPPVVVKPPLPFANAPATLTSIAPVAPTNPPPPLDAPVRTAFGPAYGARVSSPPAPQATKRSYELADREPSKK